MNKAITDNKHIIIDCLKQKIVSGVDFNPENYLREKGVEEQSIPLILADLLKIENGRRTAKSRIQEGGVITTIGLGGIAYATANEKDGTAWLLWSVVGLGILANGLWKRKKIKQYN